MPFTTTWIVLHDYLKPGVIIPNWTADKGLIGDSFLISSIQTDCILVDTPGAQNIQKIPKNNFSVVYDLWSGYCGKKVRRYEIRDVTRFSKYIISIFHWLETQIQSKLP